MPLCAAAQPAPSLLDAVAALELGLADVDDARPLLVEDAGSNGEDLVRDR